MRADRLLTLLLLLQTRGRLKARELAQELEVSERTIYRDIDALSAAGVPVYSDPGPAGGFALVDSYRTNLTGLTEGEVRALSMLSVPAALADLGVGQELKAALLKMSASLPAMRRHDEELVRQRFYIDSTWWRQGGERVPHLGSIHKAVWENRHLRIKYRPPFAIELEQSVAPYGLVAKAGVWYMVYARRSKVSAHRVSDLINVQILAEIFERPASFDLAGFWVDWCAGHESLFTAFSATVRVSPLFLPILPRYFGTAIQEKFAEDNIQDEDGWVKIELSFRSFEAARERIVGFGRGVEVLEPRALRRSVLDMAEQIVDLYKNGPA
jgi:predicted DNA-binding transcriptional regulator YafY